MSIKINTCYCLPLSLGWLLLSKSGLRQSTLPSSRDFRQRVALASLLIKVGFQQLGHSVALSIPFSLGGWSPTQRRQQGQPTPIFWPSWHLALNHTPSWFSGSVWWVKGSALFVWWDEHCQNHQQQQPGLRHSEPLAPQSPKCGKWMYRWHSIMSGHML